MASGYEIVIGLEIHVQLLTDSKIFCACSTKFGAEPNSQVCPVCSGMPGALPVLNKKALEYIVKAGLALNCNINKHTTFARKNYFYPDLPKGYQISQFDYPVCENGYLEIMTENNEIKKIGIQRIHLEEDAGKSLHPEKDNLITESYIDLNRCGVPLIEIVTKPDIRSPQEAYNFLKLLRQTILYLGISDVNMEEGSLRCDANISLRKIGETKFGTKTELKNMNSFHGVLRALEYEAKRQEAILDAGGIIEQQTLLWDDARGEARPMRSKEEAHDYRYFPDPDLVRVELDDEFINGIKNTLPELPREKFLRFKNEYGLNDYSADLLTSTPEYAEYFEKAVSVYKNPEKIANWIMGDLTRIVKETKQEINKLYITPEMIAKLVKIVDDGVINTKIAKDVFNKMAETGLNPEEIIEKFGLKQVTDVRAIEEIINKVLADNPKEVEAYKGGKEKILGFFVGQVMKLSKGKANPQIVNKILKEKLSN